MIPMTSKSQLHWVYWTTFTKLVIITVSIVFLDYLLSSISYSLWLCLWLLTVTLTVVVAFLLHYFDILNYSPWLLQSQGNLPPELAGSGSGWRVPPCQLFRSEKMWRCVTICDRLWPCCAFFVAVREPAPAVLHWEFNLLSWDSDDCDRQTDRQTNRQTTITVVEEEEQQAAVTHWLTD